MTQKQIKQSNRSQFLLSYFNGIEQYSELEVNGFWLIHHWNGEASKWTVDVYTKESFYNYKNPHGSLFS